MIDQAPYDPLGHTKIAVSDYAKSYPFYADLFAALGYASVSNKDDHAAWASPGGYGVLIAQAAVPAARYIFGAPGLHHLCLKADSPATVDRIYELVLEKKAFIFDAPQKYQKYTDSYYAVYFADPDGIKLEVAYY